MLCSFLLQQLCETTKGRELAFYRIPRRQRNWQENHNETPSVQEATTPLHEACRLSQSNKIARLIHDGANIHTKDMYGDTPLHTICGSMIRKVSVENVQRLIDHGASPNTKNSQGITPLHYACQCAQVNVVQYFLQHGGADANIRDNEGKTPLHRACMGTGNQLVIKILLWHGAQNTRDCKGWTPLHYACWYGRTEHVEALLWNARAIDVYARGNRVPYPVNDVQLSTYPFVGVDFCPTPLDLALMREHEEIVLLFKRYEEQKQTRRRSMF